MTKQTKILLGVGVLLGLYLYLKPKKKKQNKRPTQQSTTSSETDSIKSAYNIIPLPDIKGATYTSILPMQVVGQTSTSPIIIAKISK